MINFNSDTKVLITGGSGSWGQELAKHLLKLDYIEQIIIYSRNEDKQVMMKRDMPDKRIKYIIGDVRDPSALNYAMHDIDIVFSLAALKHVPLCEEMPSEAIKTNVDGTKNVIDAAINNNVKKVVYVSSDKAVDPLNVYGMTKALGERIIIQANYLRGGTTKFVSIRAGNVLGSSGSVIPFFVNQIKTKNEITITEPNMTRYFFTLSDAIDLLIHAANVSFGGEIFVMKMSSWYILDLANVLIEKYGNSYTTIKKIGLRPGEKMDEILISKHEIGASHLFNSSYFVILPSYPKDEKLYTVYNEMEKLPFGEYSSRTFLKDRSELVNLLKRGGFL
jgi:FlaA1/EpsC-like NDP-sugar epimerase